jgi:cell shape-determining protein MreC
MKIKFYIFLFFLIFGLVISSPVIAQSLADPVSNFHQIFGNPNSLVNGIQQGSQQHLAQVFGAIAAAVGFNMVINAFIK